MDIDPTTLGSLLFVLTPIGLLILYIFVLPDGASFDGLVEPRMHSESSPEVQEEETLLWRLQEPTARDARGEMPTGRREATPMASAAHPGGLGSVHRLP